jgi:hypothetical protein
MHILCDVDRTARNAKVCDHCGQTIPSGVRYRYAFIKDGGDTWSWRSHLDCHALAMRLWDEYSLMSGDNGICLLNEDMSELVLWRGEFPHVICRLELGQQLAANRRP